MTRPRLLDTYCCAGAASVGYHRAGFDVAGVDNEPGHGKRYPFEFHAGDAIEFIKAHGHEFDVIAGSPPCQRYSAGTRAGGSENHPDLVDPTRDAMIATGRPYIIENVEGAPLIAPVMLCGSEFGLEGPDDDGHPLRVERHRIFESNLFLMGAGGCQHNPRVTVAGSYGGAARRKGWTPAETRHYAKHVRHGGYVPSQAVRRRLLGIDWPMTDYELRQAIPPAYTEFLGRQIIEQLG